MQRRAQAQPVKVTAVIVLAIVAAVGGCKPAGPAKYPVQGVVRFKDEPIASGTMTLIPKSPQARTTVAQIENGKYSAEVTAGDWTVNVRAVREKGQAESKPASDSERREVPREQYIPAKYNNDSTTVITLPSDQKEFNYDLQP